MTDGEASLRDGETDRQNRQTPGTARIATVTLCLCARGLMTGAGAMEAVFVVVSTPNIHGVDI